MKTKIITVLIVLLAVSSTYWYLNRQQPAQAVNPTSAPPAVAVSVLTVTAEPVQMSLSLPGRSAPFSQSQVRPQVSGIIKERLFEEGALVAKGQPLYQLDDARYQANLKAAQANLLSAKANHKATRARYNRVKSLVSKNAVSQQDLDDVEAQLDQAEADISVAQAAVELEQINVDYSRVYAPLAGQIGKSRLTVGALVTASQAEALTVITQLDPVYVDLQVSSEQAVLIQHSLSQGQTMPVKIQAAGHSFSGTLAFSEVTVDPTTGSVAVRVVTENPAHVLLPGMFVHADVMLGEQQAFRVPQRATVRTPDGRLLVWVVDPNNNQVSQRMLDVNRAEHDQWVVTGGLQSGEQIVVEGYHKLSPGAQVTTSHWQPSDQQASNGE
jgi:membrane fusion protein (multidrug efflux system)